MARPDHKSKQQKVMTCLKKWGNTLTPLEALQYFGVFRLAPIVGRMKEQGYNIVNLNEGSGRFANYKRKR